MRSAVLDFYDDMGATLRDMIPDQDLIPDFVKTASAVTREAHPNNFALVMVDGDQVTPRYPVNDPGNAWLSALYFHGNHESLPGEAQKTAAVLIKTAMEHFGMKVTGTIEKIAGGEAVETNVVDISGQRPAAVIRPTMQDEAARSKAQFALEEADGSGVYPLNDAENAKTAAEYFDTNKHRFSFRDRREFAVKTAAALDKAGLPVTDSIASYAAEGYSPMLQAFVDVRHNYLMDMDQPDAAEHLRKIASERGTVDPETFAQSLETFDRDVGLDQAWDTHIPDPWFSTFFIRPKGLEKSASEMKPPSLLSAGSESCTEEDLIFLVKNHKELITKALGEKTTKAMCKEPIAVFKSMPTPQKIVLARLASGAKERC
tara:strand:+ start:2631 stop:3749 length:1119 start_codon:yes stop_codon:yes gene_type:complete